MTLEQKVSFIKKKNRPCGNSSFIRHSDAEIIRAYSAIMLGLLSYYRAADNFSKVKSIVAHLRKSCIFTLARKHKKDKSWAYKVYSDDVSLEIGENSSVKLPSRDYVSRLPKEFLIDESLIQFNLTTIFNRYKVRLSMGRSYFSRCSVRGCNNKDVQIHHLKKLHRKTDRSGQTSVLNRKGKRVKGLAAVLTAMHRKQLPLCAKHHLEFESHKYSELDTEYLSNLYRRAIPDSKNLNSAFSQGSFDSKPE